jgi:hypothetical protein
MNNQNSFLFKLILVFFCFPCSLSCSVTHSGSRTNQSGDVITATPQIIFLNYNIKLNRSSGEVEIRLINKIITEGRLKENSSEPVLARPGDLKCITLNNLSEPVDSITISDPLNFTVESVDDNNMLFKKEISRDSAQFSVRLQINEKIRSIAIKKNLSSDNRNSYLTITKIR